MERIRRQSKGILITVAALSIAFGVVAMNQQHFEFSGSMPAEFLTRNILPSRRNQPWPLTDAGRPHDQENPFYSFKHSNGSWMKGKAFNLTSSHPASVLSAPSSYINLTQENVKQFVFAVGASSNHFDESIDAVAMAQQQFPHHKIIFYDLGLTDDERSKVRSWCNVQLEYFNFSLYPSHVHKFSTFAFKPIIIKEALDHEVGVVWMDASFRLHRNDFDAIYDKILNNGGVFQFHPSPHTTFAATDPQMFEYLPSDTEKLKTVRMFGANSVILYRTEKVYEHLLRWWLYCAYDVDCTSPPNTSLACQSYKGNALYHFPKCHRQDQSSLATLVANLYDFDAEKYTHPEGTTFVKLTKNKRVRLYNATVCK